MTNPYASPEADLTKVSSGGEGVSEATIEALRGTKKWVRLIGVLAVIVAVITALGGVAMMFGMAMSARGGGDSVGFMIGAGGLYVLIGSVYGVLGRYLLGYARAISRLLEDGQLTSLETALQQQQKFWRIAGGLVAVMFALFVIGFGAAILIPVMKLW